MIRSRRLPTISRPYARSVGESEYPELWRGLFSAWPVGMQGGGDVAYDFSGRENHAIFSNSPTWAPGRSGGSLLFNGSSNYLSTDITLVGATRGSFAFWINNTTNDGSFDMVFSLEPQVEIGRNNSNQFFFGINDNFSLTSGEVAAIGWSHVVGTFDGSNKYIYVNRVLKNFSSFSSSLSSGPGGVGISIGGRSSAHFVTGNLDELQIYTRALTQSEIDLIYEIPYAPFVKRRRIWGFQSAAAESTFPPNSLALTGVGR